ncbi:pyridoxamine 5'-phosphate oxidase [Longimicrobium terrae]|uniref:Pyridoxamine 5'-phosphate oxidase n=1 Tax=Longimicrobium terrae TaxID=1639882 RepID=A0A841GZ30_9BACT|nr:pyridoxamine 5'-phosphate oxidase [Longimicrobium terrae]MBB4636508.1 pyridoxamine 5'-phosphate oxidase [Longimicrobium terrae]MBB6070968.1 pyridoxamine 5'-phosphate oxidase [Longimicrobium terrae]
METAYRTAPHAEPFRRFGEWMERVVAAQVKEPTAMSLATADERGRPSNRMVLLKGFDERGFVFYTNLESRKGRELAANPHAALCLFWQPLELQVRIEGAVESVTADEADEYYNSRARGSRIGAWASSQSRPLASYDELMQRVHDYEARFAEGDIPRPPHWSGFRVVPERIEFWQGRASRLHERERFEKDASQPDVWRVQNLYP